MMFNKKGYKVKLLGRAGIMYQEGDKSLIIDSELLPGAKYDIVIYKDSIKQWQPPHTEDKISEDERTRIKNNVMTSLRRMRVDWQ